MVSLHTACLILALVCFLVAAVRSLPASIDWTALGFAMVVAAFLVGGR